MANAVILDLVNFGGGVINALPSQTLNATATGSTLTLANFQAATNAVISLGSFPGAGSNILVQVEESPTSTAAVWTIIPGMATTLLTSLQAASTVQVLRGLRTYEYARVNVSTLTTGPTQASVVLICPPKYEGVGNTGTAAVGSGVDTYPSAGF